MNNFVPRRINAPYDFEITHNPHGHWTALDRGGLTGGTFLTRKDAMRFALSETGGDRRHVHVLRSARRFAGDAR